MIRLVGITIAYFHLLNAPVKIFNSSSSSCWSPNASVRSSTDCRGIQRILSLHFGMADVSTSLGLVVLSPKLFTDFGFSLVYPMNGFALLVKFLWNFSLILFICLFKVVLCTYGLGSSCIRQKYAVSRKIVDSIMKG